MELKKMSKPITPMKKSLERSKKKQNKSEEILVPFNIFKGKLKIYYEAYTELFKPIPKQHVNDTLFLSPNLQCNCNKKPFTFSLKDITFVFLD
jgi:hypothetical protein